MEAEVEEKEREEEEFSGCLQLDVTWFEKIVFYLFFLSILSVDITNYGENAVWWNITVEVNINLNFQSVDLIMIGLS